MGVLLSSLGALVAIIILGYRLLDVTGTVTRVSIQFPFLHASKLHHMNEPVEPVSRAMVRLKHAAVCSFVHLRPAFEIRGWNSLARYSLRDILDQGMPVSTFHCLDLSEFPIVVCNEEQPIRHQLLKHTDHQRGLPWS